ncbi:hypothetical protein EJ06DRAFT_235015 [Trichodelitschia bisporula]|uniref:Uncharacterized protein n=1 Tax=Trichodelitschia bisporula TaxID=703511 RepID=A0A6G1HJT8_9PEZI|nr:hypothetical protein EJ06DRAFT_235015 [Trichodelitschia bisporula]
MSCMAGSQRRFIPPQASAVKHLAFFNSTLIAIPIPRSRQFPDRTHHGQPQLPTGTNAARNYNPREAASHSIPLNHTSPPPPSRPEQPYHHAPRKLPARHAIYARQSRGPRVPRPKNIIARHSTHPSPLLVIAEKCGPPFSSFTASASHLPQSSRPLSRM